MIGSVADGMTSAPDLVEEALRFSQSTLRSPRMFDAETTSATRGAVHWKPSKSLWISCMTLAALIGGPLFFTALFLVTTGVTVCLGHSLGMHRRLIHRSYECPLWLERVFVYLGTLVGMAGPYGMIHQHDIRDWAQRKPECHPYLAHRSSMLGDGWWQLHCELCLTQPPQLAWLGGMLGRAIANHRPNSARQMLSSVAVLPMVLAGEFLLAPTASFETHNTIFIDAPPSRVWEAIVKMERIDGPPPSTALLGIAYPLGATLVGEGVGATRIAAFSTGTAIERVTEWDAGRTLTFAILQDAPSMRELSPYADLHVPHSIGYFSTKEIRFELIAGAGGGTQLIEHTSHVLKLERVLYWLPLARVIVGHNNAHVLAWIKRRAEDNRYAAPPKELSR